MADSASATVHVEATVADYVAAQKVLRRGKLVFSLWLWLVPAIIALILVMTMVDRALNNFPMLPEWAHPFITIPLALLLYLRGVDYFNRFRFRSLLDPDGPFLAPTNFHLAPEGFFWSNHRGEGRIAWHAVQKIEQTRTHIFLFVDRAMAHVVPKRSFASAQDAAVFASLAQRYTDGARAKAV